MQGQLTYTMQQYKAGKPTACNYGSQYTYSMQQCKASKPTPPCNNARPVNLLHATMQGQ
ncbi:hypothetical protein NP493_1463g01057 [Ridgeia piscesae]|uniref:Uncharacterized protein n=1 Tax=Ridgeia piscesae TaxID=27915 RepID=A0AAD9NCN5_RIDPI|nr:hypothetical protein NP493_1463g01057 [Ridgeia piscesae]